MIPLLASTVLLTCDYSKEIISNIRPSLLSDEVRTEVIQSIKDSSEKNCDWDAND